MKIVPNKKQLSIIKKYWKVYLEIESERFFRIFDLEKTISKETGIKDIEFFFSDNECVGVGNVDRTMKLIQLR